MTSKLPTKPNIVGNLVIVPHFRSQILGNERTIRIWLPPNYEGNKQRYGVLYMQDGQNLFDPALSSFSHNEWRADETAQALCLSHAIPPLIIVGIDNAEGARADEYLPTRAKFSGTEGGGRADLYGKMLITELKPLIDRDYRTLPDRRHTAIGGSSFGGVLSLYLGLTRADVFSKALVFSPSIWWDHRFMVKLANGLAKKPDLRVWLDIGTAESTGAEPDAVAMRDALVAKRWKEGKDLLYFVDYGAQHTESAWARRFGMALMFAYR